MIKLRHRKIKVTPKCPDKVFTQVFFSVLNIDLPNYKISHTHVGILENTRRQNSTEKKKQRYIAFSSVLHG